MKAIFLEAEDENDPKTMQDIYLIHEIMAIIDEVRARRVAATLQDDEGRATGD